MSLRESVVLGTADHVFAKLKRGYTISGTTPVFA
jgi:hypothetical protein